MFYNKIINPETNKKVSINSQLGKTFRPVLGFVILEYIFIYI